MIEIIGKQSNKVLLVKMSPEDLSMIAGYDSIYSFEDSNRSRSTGYQQGETRVYDVGKTYEASEKWKLIGSLRTIPKKLENLSSGFTGLSIIVDQMKILAGQVLTPEEEPDTDSETEEG
jgi:hypothetical protein